MNYYLEITSRCVSCDNCRLICPENSVFKNNEDFFIDTWSCTLCHACVEVCPVDSIKEVSKEN